MIRTPSSSAKTLRSLPATLLRPVHVSNAALFVAITFTTLCATRPAAWAAEATGKPSASAPAVRPNQTVPAVTAPTGEFSLAEPVTTASLIQTRLFPESLVVVGESPSVADNAALAKTLRAYAASRDVAELDAFVKANAASPWLPSVLTNLGLLKFDIGFYSDALAHWKQAWALGKDSGGLKPDADAIVVRALAEAVKMNCRVGRVADAKELLAQLGDRPLSGLNASMINQSRNSVVQMDGMPGDSFKCGPFALSSILTHTQRHTPATLATIKKFPTTPQGTSLAEVAELASKELGMKMQAAKRVSADAPLLLPAVVNWKLSHYAALLEKKDGRYLLADPTFGTSQWVAEEAINRETSGYFLVPAGKLPTGWLAVAADEAGGVWGRGDCAVGNGDGTGPGDPKVPDCGKGKGMAVWSIHHALASLNIEDIPLSYDPPVGPAVEFRVNYSQLEQNQPSTINFSNIGPLWNLSWLSYLTFDSNNARARMGGGGTELYTNFNAGAGTYDPEQATGATLHRLSATLFERRESDGSKLVFNLPDASGRIFLSQIVDPQGNALTMTYDADYRLVALTDAIGQVSVLAHGSNTPGDPLFYKVTRVTDPFGRFTTLAYNGAGKLTSVTDQIGITSAFNYAASGIVSELVTPYGTTTFDCGSTNTPPGGAVSYVQVTEPNGAKHRVESRQYSTTPAAEAQVPVGMPTINQYLNFRNSYYWDAKAMQDAPGDYTKARITHFLHLNISSIKAGVVESEKNPLESRVWYFHQKQDNPLFTNQGMRAANPTHIGRVLDDGSTQLDRYSYNAKGNMTQSIDPLGRTTNYTYAENGIDVLTVSQLNAAGGSDRLVTTTWNSQHRPLTVTDIAGRVTTFTYNARGQVTSATNPRGETALYAYDANGRMLSVDGSLPGTADKSHFAYDAFGRLASATNGEGYSVSAEFDALDRLTKLSYPDGTFEQTTYTALDATQTRDRLGRFTTYGYDSARRLTRATDPLGRVTTLDWCSCGSLKSVVDPLNRVTSWEQDIQGRPIAKIYPDGTKQTYRYEKTNGRLAFVTDALGQGKSLSYNWDDSLAGIIYPRAQQKTPAVTFTYDRGYPRLTSMSDGTGLTTYSYGAVTGDSTSANRLVEANTRWTNARINFTYDLLGRISSRAINGVTQSFTRDAAGRVTAMNNALGAFGYAFENASSRTSSVSLPNGQSASASYLDNVGDRRLRQIKNLQPNAAVLSQFDYTSNGANEILTWNQQASGTPSFNFNFSYDLASQLITAAAANRNYNYAYDKAANLKTRAFNSAITQLAYNVLNEVQSALPAVEGDKNYLWDAENRLVAINYAGSSRNTRFTYDGVGRCVEIAENDGATQISLRRYVWSGDERCEERDASGNVTRRFFVQGEQIGGTNYFYSFDHLGSVREMTDSSGALRARYDYDPYGVRSKVFGDLDATAGYTGHYYHSPSKLHLTRFRAYDATTGRWLSRDPLGEAAGLNYYAYLNNNPVNSADPLGLEGGLQVGAALTAGAGIAGGGASIMAGLGLSATGAGAVVGVPMIGLGLYGLGANTANLVAAVGGVKDGPSKGSLLNDAANLAAPGNETVQAVATAADLATGAGLARAGAKVANAAAKAAAAANAVDDAAAVAKEGGKLAKAAEDGVTAAGAGSAAYGVANPGGDNAAGSGGSGKGSSSATGSKKRDPKSPLGPPKPPSSPDGGRPRGGRGALPNDCPK